MGRIVRNATVVVALVASLLVASAAPAVAAPGSVTVTVNSVLGAASPDAYGFYQLALRPAGGGETVASYNGALPGEPVTLRGWDGSATTTDVEPGTYELVVGVGGPGTNGGTLARRSVTVTDGAAVEVAVTVDDRLACIEGTVRTADGTSIGEGLALMTTLPGAAAYPGYLGDVAGSRYHFDRDEFGCGVAGTFTVTVLDEAFAPLAVAGGTARPGTTTSVELVIGTVVAPTTTVSGNPDARVVTDSEGRNLITLWQGSTGDLTVTFPVTCPGDATATAVVVDHGATSVTATNSPPGSATWTATLPRGELVSGGLLATVTCPGGTTTADLGSVLLYDPSGLVTDAVSGDPVVGATVRLHEVPGWAPRTSPDDTGAATCESHDAKAPGAPWSQPAPTAEGILATQAGLDGRTSPDVPDQATDATGRYGWDVAYGCWYVTVTADGYEPLTSPVVGVPPEVTDLDLALTPLDGPPQPCVAAPFPDVPTTSDFCEDVEWLVQEGIAGGYPDGTFGPTRPVSRQAMAAFLYRFTGQDDPAGACDTTGGFADVASDHDFCHEIMWMVGAGLTDGYADGTFQPTRPISRQAMAAFLFRLAGRSEAGACPGTGFPDVPPGHDFCHEVAWMVAAGITGGYGDGTFRPTTSISRQAAAAFLHRFTATPR